MRGIRRWLTSAALLSGTAALAQSTAPPPTPAEEPPIAAALPGGTVVGSHGTTAPAAAPLPAGNLVSTNDTPAPSPVPAAAAPLTPVPATDTPLPPAVDGVPEAAPLGVSGLFPGPFPGPMSMPGMPPAGGCGMPGGDCCGPIGGHGPIGQEVYFRVGASFPLGNALIARGLNTGWVVHGGGRSQFFDASGDAAWVLDGHLFYAYNNAAGEDFATVRGEPQTVRALHRSGVGLGIGRDYFLAGPGFVGGMWDANLRYGWDVGGRWGAGHVDLNPFLRPGQYARNYDVFGQPYFGLNATLEIPVGGYTTILGGRLEYNYNFSDLLPKQGSFQEVVGMFMCGVRY